MKFKKKPVVIEAVQFNVLQTPWPRNVRQRTRSTCSDPQCGDSTWDHACNLGELIPAWYVWNPLHNSEINLKPGDYVRVDDPNDTYPINAATFTATYEPVEDDTPIERPTLASA